MLEILGRKWLQVSILVGVDQVLILSGASL